MSQEMSAHLARLEIFQGLEPGQLAAIARTAARIVYKTGQLLIADGEPGDAAVLVINGEAIRTKGQSSSSQQEVVEPGSLLGEMAMLIETDYSSTVVAVGTVRALRIPRAAMLELMLADPSLADHFIMRINGRLKRLAGELRTIDSKLAGVLDEAAMAAMPAALPAPEATMAAH